MNKLVTIAIPVYKRLHCLPQALKSVQVQDYADIELMVSDNGLNGVKVSDIVRQCYARPYVFRQNSVSVNIPTHYNQLLQAASGHYFVWMPDDDAMSSNYISELVRTLESNPRISVAIARQEVVDATGHVMRTSPSTVPALMTGEDLVRKWTENGFESYTGILVRTADARRCGGYPDYPGGTHVDDALLVKLCLNHLVAFNHRCTYRLANDESSFGWSLKWQLLAEDTRRFLKFLNSDPMLLAYANEHREQWVELKECLAAMTWGTYLYRWATLYQRRLPLLQWVRAAFAMPFIPNYYRQVRSLLLSALNRYASARIKILFPRAHKIYRALRYRA